jgi:hypothetical protein
MRMVRKSGLAVGGAVLLAVGASVALAQVRQIQMGAGMDANPMVGAGGSNQPIQGYVPINGNDVVTGNVSGLKYFHGPTAAQSPYQFGGSSGGTRSVVVGSTGSTVIQQSQFGGNLGSSALAGFARQTAGGPITGGQNSGLSQPYYLPSATVSTGGGALFSAPVGGGFDSALVPSSAISPMASSAQINAITQRATIDPQAINRAMPANLMDTASYAGSASTSLFSLRLPEGAQKAAPPALPGNGITPELPERPGQVGPGAGGPTTLPGGWGGPERENSEEIKPNPAEIVPSINMQQDPRIRSQTAEVKTALVGDNYMKLAQELRTVQGLPASNAPGGTGQESLWGPPAMDVGGRAGTSNKTAGAAGAGDEIDPLTGLRRQISLRPPGAATAPALSAKSLTDLSTAELTAGGKVKPVKLAAAVVAGAPQSDFDTLMLRGEDALNAGKYLDALRIFHAALADKPEDPLALVGRAHAELGAGIYSAAAYDLKFIFARKPGMVAVRYDPQSFIPVVRQEFLLQDLLKLTDNKDSANMASFLYCYLCYENGHPAALQTELKRWNAREGHDTWAAVAARAWGGGK